MPEATLKALAGSGAIGPPLAADGGDCEAVLARFAEAGIDVDALAAQLQEAGARSFADSWNALMDVLETKGAAVQEEVARRSVPDPSWFLG